MLYLSQSTRWEDVEINKVKELNKPKKGTEAALAMW